MNLLFSALGITFVLGLLSEGVRFYRMPPRQRHAEQKRCWRETCRQEQARRRRERR